MIILTGGELALLNAVVARIDHNDSHFPPNGDPTLALIGEMLDAQIEVYDVGRKGDQYRLVRFTFDTGEGIEINVKKRPDLPPPPELIPDDDGDGGTPGTPVITKLAEAA